MGRCVIRDAEILAKDIDKFTLEDSITFLRVWTEKDVPEIKCELAKDRGALTHSRSISAQVGRMLPGCGRERSRTARRTGARSPSRVPAGFRSKKRDIFDGDKEENRLWEAEE